MGKKIQFKFSIFVFWIVYIKAYVYWCYTCIFPRNSIRRRSLATNNIGCILQNVFKGALNISRGRCQYNLLENMPVRFILRAYPCPFIQIAYFIFDKNENFSRLRLFIHCKTVCLNDDINLTENVWGNLSCKFYHFKAWLRRTHCSWDCHNPLATSGNVYIF